MRNILCPIQCFRFRIKKRGKKLYIGKGCKIVNAVGMTFGTDVSIMPYTMLVCHGKGIIHFGEGSEIGMYSRIASQNQVLIGKNVLFGPHIFIADYNHEYRDVSKPIKLQGRMIKVTPYFISGGVSIGDDTWIGTNVVIAGTIQICKHCIIGANSVVTHDIPDYCVAVGQPCKVVKRYNMQTDTWDSVKE